MGTTSLSRLKLDHLALQQINQVTITKLIYNFTLDIKKLRTVKQNRLLIGDNFPPSFSCHLPTQSACTSSAQPASCTCTQCTPFSTRFSSLFSPKISQYVVSANPKSIHNSMNQTEVFNQAIPFCGK
jgi:hypothetical protein